MTYLQSSAKDPEWCTQFLLNARAKFGDTRTTVMDLERLSSDLTELYLYCPENLAVAVYATMDETNRRKSFYMFRPTQEPTCQS
jgi:hypothetical protein